MSNDKRRAVIEQFLRLGNPADDPSWRAFAGSTDSIPHDRIHGIFAEAAVRARSAEPFATQANAVEMIGATGTNQDDDESEVS